MTDKSEYIQLKAEQTTVIIGLITKNQHSDLLFVLYLCWNLFKIAEKRTIQLHKENDSEMIFLIYQKKN